MDASVNDLAQTIQIVVAPIFMLTGIAGFLNVMSGRLGRIVDRARIMERRVHSITFDYIRLKTLYCLSNHKMS
jgi:hypothetical protein